MVDADRSDAEFIVASLRDPEEFAMIYKRHHDAVFRFSARRVGIAEAEDVVSSVFERALRIRRRYDLHHPDSLPWLYGIAANIVGDRHRRQRRAERVYLVSDAKFTKYDPADDAVLRVAAEQVAPLVNRVLAQLSARDRETFLLYALEEQTYAEISRSLNVPIGTVGSRISRVRATMLKHIPDLEQRAGLGAPGMRTGDDS